MKYQKILTMTTNGPSLRSGADSWGFEDASNFQHHQGIYPYIGLASVERNKATEFHCFDCPVRAMANGWRLMQPPQKFEWTNQEGQSFTQYEWWFEKMVLSITEG